MSNSLPVALSKLSFVVLALGLSACASTSIGDSGPGVASSGIAAPDAAAVRTSTPRLDRATPVRERTERATHYTRVGEVRTREVTVCSHCR
jgi:hypothetical protein